MQICSSDILRMRTGGPVQLELLPLKPEIQNLRARHSQASASHELILWGVNCGSGGGAGAGQTRSFIDVNAMPSTSGDDGDAGTCTLQLSGGGGGGPGCGNGGASSGFGKRERDGVVNKGPAESGDFYTATTEVTSRISDEEESGSSRKKLRLTKEQSALLEESFKEHSTLNPKQKNALAKQLNLRPRQVEVWFQNRRARTKLKQTEIDFELLKKCFESLTEENRRLRKEVAELRALKVGAPCVISHDFYMPLPAATLTMCPSCERLAPNRANSGAGGVGVSQSIQSIIPTSSTVSDFATAAAAAKPLHFPLTFPSTQQQQPSAAC